MEQALKIKKHAYLIIAHNNFKVLEILLKLIDDERNDIFIHIDKKVKNFKFSLFKELIKKSKIYFIHRKKIFWADYSQVEVTFDLLNASVNKYNYHYYHLLSGSDLPIKTQDEIHQFFFDKNNEFIGVVKETCKYHLDHVNYYYPFLNTIYYRKFKVIKFFVFLIVQAQKLIGYKRINNKKIKFVDGWQWFSISNKLAKCILKNKNKIKTIFNYCKAPDEMFIQTFVVNTKFNAQLYNHESLGIGSMRHIDWKRGNPYVFHLPDFDELISSSYLFARKFDEKVDFAIAQKIYDYLTSKPLIIRQ